MSGFDINTVTVSGNLCKAPELRNLPSGQSVCSLRIAHNERYKDASGEWADRTAYFDVTIWSGLGEWMGKNLHKGQKVVVSGRRCCCRRSRRRCRGRQGRRCRP